MKKIKSRFKFRIWDNAYKVFRTQFDASLHCSSNWYIDTFTGKVVDFVDTNCRNDCESYTKSEDNGYYMNGLKLINKPQYIVQQWTGIVDDKKKDIYEGDIVLLNAGKPYESKYEVIYNDCAFSLISANRDGDKYGVYTRNLRTDIKSDTMQVIGNIFENKELLK